MAKALRTRFRCVIVDPNNSGVVLCTGIMIDLPLGLNRIEAINFVADRIAKEVRRYAASEALGLGPFGPEWTEKVT